MRRLGVKSILCAGLIKSDAMPTSKGNFIFANLLHILGDVLNKLCY